MILDITTSPSKTLCIINIYHDIPDGGHALAHVLASRLDPLMPTLVVGDFNTHS
jgi:hypothetical protein